MDASIFDTAESNVRSYCRSFPAVFTKAKGARLWSEDGRSFVDFFAGAGALNYGHNPEPIKRRIIEYLADDGVTHALDMHTGAKRSFLEALTELLLEPRRLPFKAQFCGPTGANAVEAALKVARKATGRTGVFAFTGGFHGMSLGALSATSNRASRAGAGMPLGGATFLPFPGFVPGLDTLGYLRAVLEDGHSGVELPAAMIVEPVQAEGGVHVAGAEWLAGLRELCDRFGIVLIFDEIQVGCGRTGPFFAFESSGVVPDIVTLSKALSGYGLPMSLVLLRPELDVWEPAEHTGTFRGNQLAFVAATASLQLFHEAELEQRTRANGKLVGDFLATEVAPLAPGIGVRGAGLIWGVDVAEAGGPERAAAVAARCFDGGLLIERAGRRDTVLKLLPPLTIERDELEWGCDLLRDAVAAELDSDR
jgi:diaminobutyrate-2-oxoglutarate transaminase